MQLTDVDLLNPDIYVHGVPHHVFRRLRAEAPVLWQQRPEGEGFWVITKYHDVAAVSQDWATFSSARGVVGLDELEGGTELMMLNMDPPRHDKLRKLVSPGFTLARIKGLEAAIRRVTNQVLDQVAPKGGCDFVTEVAAELPLQVIAELMGIPQEDRRQVFDWSNTMIGGEDQEYQTSPDAAMKASLEMYAYAEKLANQRRQRPGDDLVSVLMGAEVDGEKLTPVEFDVFFLLLAVAGNETTRNLISGGLLALMEHPQQWARLRADPSLMPAAVEEMLRWVTPVMYFRRTATRDTEIRGQKIRAGDKVTIWYVSANRDEEVFSDPDRFDVGRHPNFHLAFGGGGPHNCLGLNLARLEIRVMFEELMRRLPDIQLAGPAQRLRSSFINGIKHMPVRFTSAEAGYS